MKKQKIILDAIVSECSRHLHQLNYALSKISPLLPLTAKKLKEFNEEDTGYMDQYIFRFSKLQDAIGQKLFKSVLGALGEDIGRKSFLDIFNRLEQLGVVQDYPQWNRLREIRNEISHEYDENKRELAEKLNTIIQSKEVLEQYMKDVLAYLQNRKIIN